MVTVLDLSTLRFFDRVWPFLLVLVVVYAGLSYVGVFSGEGKKGTRAMIAFILAILASSYNIAWKTLNLAAPWFVLLFFLIIFLLIAYQLFGIKETAIVNIITGKEYGRTFAYWTLALVLIITIGSLSSVVSEERKFTRLTEGGIAPAEGTQGGDDLPLSEQVGFFATITHPKVLGMVLILLIAFFTIANLVEKT